MKTFKADEVDPHQLPTDDELQFMASKVASAFLRPSESQISMDCFAINLFSKLCFLGLSQLM